MSCRLKGPGLLALTDGPPAPDLGDRSSEGPSGASEVACPLPPPQAPCPWAPPLGGITLPPKSAQQVSVFLSSFLGSLQAPIPHDTEVSAEVSFGDSDSLDALTGHFPREKRGGGGSSLVTGL